MTADNSEPIARYMLLSVLESAFNTALRQDPQAIEALQSHCGRIIRVKGHSPRFSCYMMLCEDGIQIFADHEGEVDARIRGSSSLMAMQLLGPRKEPFEWGEIVVTGNEELVQELGAIAARFNLWNIVNSLLLEWLPEHEGLRDILKAIRNNDPAWMERIQHLPALLDDTVLEIRRQREIQQLQLEEIRALHSTLGGGKRNWILICGVLLVLLGAVNAVGWIDLSALQKIPPESSALMLLGALFILFRWSR
ncbi:MAG TPA: SCP2 sterol-binding domain-containing protein [Pseudomonadales bacterium]|nr:SCP2 sterol-binding domain-containing protein [Pseudomonadales bacterium]